MDVFWGAVCVCGGVGLSAMDVPKERAPMALATPCYTLDTLLALSESDLTVFVHKLMFGLLCVGLLLKTI